MIPSLSNPSLARFRHIAIEGPIGAGKTSLAKALAERLAADTLFERPAENPFLGRFYEDMPGYAFQTQLFFLFQRQKQLQAIAQPSMFASHVVSDFMFAKDEIFARLTLSDEEFRLYSLMHAPIAAQLRQPDLVIWLQASTSALQERVKRRGVAMEQRIEPDYLRRLASVYADYFRRNEQLAVLAVDTEHFNPAASRDDMQALLQRLEGFAGQRAILGEVADATHG